MFCLARYDVIITYICFHRNVLSAIFAEESHLRRVARVKFVIGTTRYDWSYKNIGSALTPPCGGLEQ